MRELGSLPAPLEPEVPERPLAAGAEVPLPPLQRRVVARADAVAVAASRRPLAAFAAILSANAALAAAFAGIGAALGDPAEGFRELMPGTWLSFAQLLLIAATARAIHVRATPRPIHVRRHGRAAWHRDFWGLSAVLFAVFAVDEITQTSQFLGTWLNQGAGLSPAEGFNDVGAVILTLLFAAAALLLLPRAAVLLRHPLALALLALGGVIGAASQGLDSFVAPTTWEFVAEESLKLAAEACLIGAYLAALRDVLARGGAGRAGG